MNIFKNLSIYITLHAFLLAPNTYATGEASISNAVELKVINGSFTADIPETKKVSSYGSGKFKDCTKAASKDWEAVEPTTETWSNGWATLKGGDSFAKEIEQITVSNGNEYSNLETLKKFARDRIIKTYNKAVTKANELYECQAAAAITGPGKWIDYGNDEHTKKGSAQSFDGRIQCVTDGANTQDFPACAKMATAAAVFKIGGEVMGVVQSVDTQETAFKEQQKVSKEKNYFKGGLMMEKKMLQKRAQQERQRAILNSAKFATFLAAYKKMPTQDELEERCSQRVNPNIGQDGDPIKAELEALKESLDTYAKTQLKYTQNDNEEHLFPNGVFGSNEESPVGQPRTRAVGIQPSTDLYSNASSLCNEVAYMSSFKFMQNDSAKEVAKMMMVEAGIDVTKNLLSSSMLDKQADVIDKALGEIEDFEPIDPLLPGQEVALSIERCTAEPNLPGCDAIFGQDQEFGFQGGTVNLGGTGQNTVAGQIADADGNPIAAAGDTPVGTSGDEGGTPGTVDVADKSNDFLGGGGTNSSGGSAGPGANDASGSAGGGSSIGSGVEGGAGGGEARVAAAAGSVKSRYRGGFTSPKFSGGKGRSSNSSKSSKNPFDSLFGKKGKKKNAGKNLNFRGIASNKKGRTIFHQISRRYDKVEEDKRIGLK